MNYSETLDYLFTRLPMFQRSGPAAYKNSLENTLKLDVLYDHPHKNYKTIHVAGTNGKGSVSHMLASVLQSAGLKVGLYTSPHLKDFRERIRINGKMISEENVVAWVDKYCTNNKLWKIEPSFFELTVALALDYFAQQKIDIAIMEVGLGGRLDSTNIITPEVSVITNIGYDHTNLLGNTLEKIAVEKAGIIKTDVPVVIGTTQTQTEHIFKGKAQEKGAEIFFADGEYCVDYATLGIDGKQNLKIVKDEQTAYEGLRLDLLGAYQHKNVPAVLKTVDILKTSGIAISNKALFEGLANVTEKTGLLGRWQILDNNPLVVCDTGHNEDGVKAIVEQIKNTAYKKLHFIFGTVGDKDPENVLKLLPKEAEYYFVKANLLRAMNAEELARRAEELGLKGKVYSSVKSALSKARELAEAQDLIFVGGSTFVVAEIL